MTGWVPPRLRPLLGNQLSEVGPPEIDHLVGIREDYDLEFKLEHHGTGDAPAREAAADLAQMANTSGGLVVFGIAEDAGGTATEVAGLVATQRDDQLWLNQVVVS